MKLNISLSKKESEVLAKVMKAYDFESKVSCEKLSNKYREGNEAGSFEYSGLTDNGVQIKFETHEKLMIAAANVYLKYSSTVNGILSGIKSVVLSCKALFKNFEADYKAELNRAFDEIKVEAKMKAEAQKAEAKIREEIREKAEADLLKRKLNRIRSTVKVEDDDELY
jgi:hypothetical protein|nr:MAG TPA: hypothetical protein [Caudoviricetes sp.]